VRLVPHVQREIWLKELDSGRWRGILCNRLGRTHDTYAGLMTGVRHGHPVALPELVPGVGNPALPWDSYSCRLPADPTLSCPVFYLAGDSFLAVMLLWYWDQLPCEDARMCGAQRLCV